MTPRHRPYPTCLCAPEDPCVACPLAHACSCGSAVAQRCRRPSGHRGHFVMTHEDRMLRSDANAIARDAAEVEARLRAQRDDPDAMALWARALRGLQRRPAIWRDQIGPAVIARLLALASGRGDAPEQLALL